MNGFVHLQGCFYLEVETELVYAMEADGMLTLLCTASDYARLYE